ncbi:hypothetical protein NMY22_g13829 [Coprinellus aureogranulatus]|nr:hypothetical protein NMY22_g13829 [Coprinellus aureogranulatus]
MPPSTSREGRISTDESSDANGERTSSPNPQASIASLGSIIIAAYVPRDVEDVSRFVLTDISFVGACGDDEGGKGFASTSERQTSMSEDQRLSSFTYGQSYLRTPSPNDWEGQYGTATPKRRAYEPVHWFHRRHTLSTATTTG